MSDRRLHRNDQAVARRNRCTVTRVRQRLSGINYDCRQAGYSEVNTTPEELSEKFNATISCEICNIPTRELDKNLCIDHDHETGKFRGLLCHRCNLGLEKFSDNPDVLLKAAVYLEQHNSNNPRS